MFAQVGGVNKKNLLSTVCVCACVRAHLQNASPCLFLDGHVLSSLCAKLPSKHTSRPHVCRHLAPRPRAASSLCPLRLSRRQPAQGSSRQRDKHPIAIKHTLAYHGAAKAGRPNKGSSFARPIFRRQGAPRWPNNSEAPEELFTSASCESATPINWRRARLGIRPEGRGNPKTRGGWQHSENKLAPRLCVLFCVLCVIFFVAVCRKHRRGAVVQQRGHVHLIGRGQQLATGESRTGAHLQGVLCHSPILITQALLLLF